MDFNKRIKEIRGTRTMAEFSDVIGISIMLISAWETGRAMPSINKLIQLSEHLNLSTDYILGLSDESNYIPKSNTTSSVNIIDLINNGVKLEDNPTGIIQTDNNIIKYTTEPMNTLIIDNSSNYISYIKSMIELITHSNHKKNIVANVNLEITPELKKQLLDADYQIIDINDINSTNASFNILESMKHMTDDQILNTMLNLISSYTPESMEATILIHSKAVYLTELYKLYKEKDPKMSFKSFHDFSLKHDVTSKLKINHYYPNRSELELNFAKSAIKGEVINLLDMLSKLTLVEKLENTSNITTNINKPLFINFHTNPTIDFANTNNEKGIIPQNECFHRITNAISYIIGEKMKSKKEPTYWIKKLKDVNLTEISTNIALNQELCIISNDKITETNNNIILANVNLIVNNLPLSDSISNMLSKQFEIPGYTYPYTIYNGKYQPLTSNITNQSTYRINELGRDSLSSEHIPHMNTILSLGRASNENLFQYFEQTRSQLEELYGPDFDLDKALKSEDNTPTIIGQSKYQKTTNHDPIKEILTMLDQLKNKIENLDN